MSKILKTILIFVFPVFCFDMVKPDDVKNHQNNKKIINDTVEPGRFPFLVQLVTKDGKFVCSGSIVSKIKVLTAAHCLLPEEAEIVVAGSVDTKAVNNSYEQRRNIMKYVVHPKYSEYLKTFKKRNWSNDLGMVTLEKRFTATLAVKIIPIATDDLLRDKGDQRYHKRLLYEWFYGEYPENWNQRSRGRRGLVVGVGNNNFVGTERRGESKSGETDKAECVNDGKVHFTFFRVKFKKAMLNEENPVYVSLPYNPNKVICGSDAGGPLINPRYPIFLHGVHCNNTDHESYDVSTTVPENHKWILSQLDGNSTNFPKVRRKNGQKEWKFEHVWTLSVFCIIQFHGYI